MSKKAEREVKPGSAPARIAFEGGLTVAREQLKKIDATAKNIGEALDYAGIIKLFNLDQTQLTSQQVELLTQAAHGLEEMIKQLEAAHQTAEVLKGLLPPDQP